MPKQIKKVSQVQLYLAVQSDVVNRVGETWARTMKAEAPDMYEKLLKRIPDMEKFQSRVGGPSTSGFVSFVHPDFVSKKGANAQSIKTGQAANLKRAYEKYRAKLKFLFETVDGIPAKRFCERVEMMKEVFKSGLGARTIPFTGTKIEGKGCAAIAAHWLTGDLKVVDHLRAADQMPGGGPFRVCRVRVKGPFKAALQGRLQQAGAEMVKSEFAKEVIKEENDLTNQLVQDLVDPDLNIVPFETGGASHVDYLLDEANQPWLEVQVSVYV